MRDVLHYSILDQLGAGGMGVVYRAVDTKLDRLVALKFLPPAVAGDDDARRRLVNEARAAARLDHPHIGAIYGIEGLDAEPFIVMAYYEGQNLQDRLRAGPLAVAEAVALALQAAGALELAHRHGITHRDVKPANLLVMAEGVVKVLDFGLARREALDGLTMPGQIVGTPAYLAPEQVRGQAVDHRVDLWALGAVLYEMLTGVAAFASEAGLAATLLGIVRDEPEPIERFRDDVPVALRAVVGRALCKERDLRYASAGELIADLRAVAEGDVASTAVAAAFAARPTAPSVRSSVAAAAPTVALPSDAALPLSGAASGGDPAAPTVVLPNPSGPLLGRADELALAHVHLADPHCRLLTLFGVGGTGKTRLAIEVAREEARLGHYPDGIHFVPLEALDDATRIPSAIAVALGLTLQGDDEVLAQVVRSIADRSVLLVLDNFESVIDGADVTAELVAGCHGLAILATSRERLNVEPEWVLPIGGLTAPPSDSTADLEQALGYHAVSLFVQRARRTDVRFALADDDVPHVAEVCRMVHGLPLGVELAAGWVKSLSCREIAQELRSSLDFLESGSRTVGDRHRSLRAAFDASWTLLTPDQQRLLAALTVFRGGFTKEAAKAVTGAGVRQLLALADKALLEMPTTGRYDLHPIVHRFAEERLAGRPDDGARLRDEHGRYFHRLLQEREEELAGRGHREARAALAADEGNLWVAWRWAVAGAHVEVLLASARPLEALFDGRGRHREVAKLFGEAVAGIDGADPRHHAALGVVSVYEAWAWYSLGRLVGARAAADRGLAWLRPTGDGVHLLKALNTSGAIAYASGTFGDARDLWREALSIARRLGNRRFIGTVLGNLASAEQGLGEYEASQQRLEEALAISREVDDPAGIVSALANLAKHAVRTGALDKAQTLIEEAIAVARSVGFDAMLPTLLHHLGVVHQERREYPEALALHGEALGLVRAFGDEYREAHVLTSIAASHVALGAFAEAAVNLRDSVRLAWANNDLPTLLLGFRELADWHAGQGRVAVAVALATMVGQHPAADRAAVDASATAIASWAEGLAPEEVAEARARGASLALGDVVAESLRELGTAAG